MDLEQAIDTIEQVRGTVLVVGGPDTGKTTRTFAMACALAKRGLKVAIVDSDLGQSSIGPPATVGMGLIGETEEAPARIVPAACYFVGSVSPRGVVEYHVSGVRMMALKARELGAATILVDTTGTIQGYFGRTLKQSKYAALSPDLVVSFQRGSEAEHVLAPLEKSGARILRLSTPGAVRYRSPAERKEYRRSRWAEAFEPSSSCVFAIKALDWKRTRIGSGRICTRDQIKDIESRAGRVVLWAETAGRETFAVVQDAPAGSRDRSIHLVSEEAYRSLLCGLLSSDGFLCLGIIDRFDFAQGAVHVTFSSRVPSDDVRGIIPGIIKVTPRGEEIGYISYGEV